MPALLLLVFAAIVGCGASPAPVTMGGDPPYPPAQPGPRAGEAHAAASPGAASDRGAACGALIDAVNRGVTALEKMDGYAGLEELERMAAVRDGMARDIEGVGPTAPDLRAWAGEYVASIRQTATTLRALGAAARRGDAGVRTDGARDLDAATKKEEQLVERVNAICHGS